jgi:septal ring factor EnvC (AmiA/AmiB activator)
LKALNSFLASFVQMGSPLSVTYGIWRSLVARPLWERKAGGSNPPIPTWHILSLVMLVAFASCSVAFYLYARSTKSKIVQKNNKISELEMTVAYAEAGLDMCNKKIKALTNQISELNSENKLLTAKISKISNQFKNVKDYLNKN